MTAPRPEPGEPEFFRNVGRDHDRMSLSELDEHGIRVGRDPRKITQAELRAANHQPMSPIDAIRAKCLDCCADSPNEVRLCMATSCPSWPFRMGKNPWRAPVSEAKREAGRRAALRMHAKLADHGQHPASGAATPPAGSPVPKTDEAEEDPDF